jgi:hypothetical protein
MKTKIFDINTSKISIGLKPIKYDIDGAPFRIDNAVQVLNNPNNDETFNCEFSGKKGTVVYYEYDCGCGQSYPNDPMIGVRFADKKVAEFWKEELQLLKK